MSTIVKTFRKASIERRRLYLDYSCFLEAEEKLLDLQVTVSPATAEAPLTVTSAFSDEEFKKFVVYAAGGVPNTDYVMSMVVRTDGGQTKKDDIGMRVTL